jgi:hypothetical protein
MVPVKILCRKHLLGEHVEHHMFAGHLKRKRGLDGYIRENCIEMMSIYRRHDELSEEMKRRGYNHKSEIDLNELNCSFDNYERWQVEVTVDRDKSLRELIRRCPECMERYKKYM